MDGRTVENNDGQRITYIRQEADVPIAKSPMILQKRRMSKQRQASFSLFNEIDNIIRSPPIKESDKQFEFKQNGHATESLRVKKGQGEV